MEAGFSLMDHIYTNKTNFFFFFVFFNSTFMQNKQAVASLFKPPLTRERNKLQSSGSQKPNMMAVAKTDFHQSFHTKSGELL